MTAVTAIVLPDALATPVNHTFVPLGPDTAGGTWWYEDQSASAPIGYGRVSLLLSRPKGGAVGASSQDRVARVKIGVHLPQLETLSNNSAGLLPAPTIAFVPRLNMEFILPERSTLQNRKDLRKFALGLLADPALIAMVESLQGVY